MLLQKVLPFHPLLQEASLPLLSLYINLASRHQSHLAELWVEREGAGKLHAGYFLTKIFHPNVSKPGEICVNVLKRDWKPEMGLRHVLVIVRCLLIEPFPGAL